MLQKVEQYKQFFLGLKSSRIQDFLVKKSSRRFGQIAMIYFSPLKIISCQVHIGSYGVWTLKLTVHKILNFATNTR